MSCKPKRPKDGVVFSLKLNDEQTLAVMTIETEGRTVSLEFPRSELHRLATTMLHMTAAMGSDPA